MYILDAYSKTIKKFKEEKFKIMKMKNLQVFINQKLDPVVLKSLIRLHGKKCYMSRAKFILILK